MNVLKIMRRQPAETIFGISATLLLFLLPALTQAQSQCGGNIRPFIASFGNCGKLISSLEANPLRAKTSAMVRQADGKIIGVGGEGDGFALARYNRDGSLDATFGTNGRVITRFGNISDTARAAVIQPDGKIVVAGFSQFGVTPVGLNLAFARYNTDGTLDAAFGGGTGKTAFAIYAANQINAIALQSNGKIVATGTDNAVLNGTGSNFMTIRLNADGTRDLNFGTFNGVKSDAVGSGSATNFAYDVKVDANDKIYITGNGNTGQIAFLARYTANGTQDQTFNGDGQNITLSGQSYALRLAPNGQAYIAGVQGSVSTSGNFLVARFNADGTRDTAFGTANTDFNNQADTAFALDLQPDGKIVVAGQTRPPGFSFSQGDFAVARYNTNGTLDTTFGRSGKFIIDFFTGIPEQNSYSLDTPTDVCIDPIDSTILIGGDTKIVRNGISDVGPQFAATRLQMNAAVANQPMFDFSGDGKTDFSVFRPSSAAWYIQPSETNAAVYGISFGLAADKLTPADFDGDGKTDLAVWREGAFAYFYILNSTNNTFRAEQFGQTGDNPLVVGDWDGDGRADPIVYRPAANAGGQSYFFIRPSSQPGVNFLTIYWGTAGDEPIRGDFDGDGRMDAAVYRASDNIWYIRQSSNQQARYARWGSPTDKRVTGDFDGDGKTDLAIYRDGLWAILQSSNNQQRYEQFGQAGDRIAAGDYDGDGRTDLAIFRNGVFYIKQSTNSQLSAQSFGAEGDVPVASAYVP